MAATAKFFGTYELLEPTLLHLPFRDLLLAQRINKACFDVIERSHDIRRALFFEASAEPFDAEDTWQWKEQKDKDATVVDPFIRDAIFEEHSPIEDTLIMSPNYEIERLRKYEWTFSTHMEGLFRANCVLWRYPPRQAHVVPSRNKMLLTHPPISKFEVGNLDGDSLGFYVVNAAGVTTDDIRVQGRSFWQRIYGQDTERRKDTINAVQDKESDLMQMPEVEFCTCFSGIWVHLDPCTSMTGYETLHALDNPGTHNQKSEALDWDDTVEDVEFEDFCTDDEEDNGD